MADSPSVTPFKRPLASSRGSPAQDEDSAFKPSDKNRLLKVEKGEVPCIQLKVNGDKIEGTVACHIERHEAELSSLKETGTQVQAALADLKRTFGEDKDTSANRESKLQERVTKMEDSLGTMMAQVTKIADSEAALMREMSTAASTTQKGHKISRALEGRLMQVEIRLGRLTVESLKSETALDETKKKLSEMEEANNTTKRENAALKQMVIVMSDTMKLKVEEVEDDIKMLTEIMEKNIKNVEFNKKTSAQVRAQLKLIMQSMENHMSSFVMFAEKVAHMVFGDNVNLGLDWMTPAMWQLQAQMSTLSNVPQIPALLEQGRAHDVISESDTTSGPPSERAQPVQPHGVVDRIGALERSLSHYIGLSQRYGNPEYVHPSLATPAIFPNEYVRWLQQLDFRPPCGMTRFRDVDVRVDKHMLLSYDNHCYYLQQINNVISFKEPVCLARDQRGLSDEDFYPVMDRPCNERLYKDTVMELTAKCISDQATLPGSRPRYVVILGEVFCEHEDPHLSGRTGYYLAMDIVSPSKALWLVFGYEYKTLDRKIKRTPLISQGNNKLCASLGCPEFDVAKVAHDVEDWDKTSGVRLYDQPELEPSAVRGCIDISARTAGLVFTSPNLSALLLEIQKGWRGYRPPHQNGTST
jgi:hypothetical protein